MLSSSLAFLLPSNPTPGCHHPTSHISIESGCGREKYRGREGLLGPTLPKTKHLKPIVKIPFICPGFWIRPRLNSWMETCSMALWGPSGITQSLAFIGHVPCCPSVLLLWSLYEGCAVVGEKKCRLGITERNTEQC